MPLYIFSNPSDDNDIIEVVMSVHDNHEYIRDGIKWNRNFTKPTAAIDTKNDAFDHKKNLHKIASTKGSLGDMQDFAKEQSVKREEKLGKKDPVKQKFFDSYAEKRGGKRHVEERQAKAKELTKDVMIKFKSKLK